MDSSELLPNEQAQRAGYFVNNTDVSVFLTGKAGTGKTTFLRQLVGSTFKRHVVLAPTGVAAINAQGVTIHSFFQLPLDPYLPDVPELLTEYQMSKGKRLMGKNKLNIIRSLDLLIIDEISMVRADLLDAVDAALRRYRRSSLPFGGVQLLMIGDIHQLAPVVTDSERPYIERVYPSPFFFHSKALQKMKYVVIQFDKVFRQQDEQLLYILNNIRDNCYSDEVLSMLNQRYNPSLSHVDADAIRLTTHNYQADSINADRLAQLDSPSCLFSAVVEGEFPESMYPVDLMLSLKVGARVMFVKNDTSGDKRYYNGMLATVVRVDGDEQLTVVSDDGDEVEVVPASWENVKYELDGTDGQIRQVVTGVFRQIPLRLAWAVTIHKAQGLTFDNVIVDAAAAFAYGQVYVALSRCRSLQGLHLASPITSSCLRYDAHVDSFDNAVLTSQPDLRLQLQVSRRDYFIRLYLEAFSFAVWRDLFEKVVLFYVSHLQKKFPETTQLVQSLSGRIDAEMYQVAERFRVQVLQYVASVSDLYADPFLAQRARDASGYFLPVLVDIDKGVSRVFDIEVKNKEHKSMLSKLKEEYAELFRVKHEVMKYLSSNDFDIESYLRCKNLAAIDTSHSSKKRSKKKMFD